CYPVVPEVVASKAAQSSLLRELAPCRAPALRGGYRIVAANANGCPIPSLKHAADECGNEVMVWLACSELLGANDQLLYSLQSIGAQRNRADSAFGLALLKMNLASQENET